MLGGTALTEPTLSGFLSSDFDPFLNHLFTTGKAAPAEITHAMAGRPAFVWLAEEPTDDPAKLTATGLQPMVMHGMTATTEPPGMPIPVAGEIAEVCSRAELDDWYQVYSEVFGADARGREDWYKLHDALAPNGDRSLSLLLARADGLPSATAAGFYEPGVVGLYCFTTREPMRGRGLASALVQASHAAARAKDIEHALLHATDAGRPVYARAG